MTQLSILDYFSGIPREVQRDTLLEVEKEWANYDVFALVLPTGSGKSRVAMAISDWQQNVDIITPTNVLLKQYVNDFPDMPFLQKKDMYTCCIKSQGATHKNCQHERAKFQVMHNSNALMNYYMYLATLNQGRMPAPTLIVDECHNLIPMIQDLNAKEMWQKKTKYPDWVHDSTSFLRWATNSKSISTNTADEKAFYDEIITQLTSHKPKYIFERTKLWWLRTKPPQLRDAIRWRPVDIRTPETTILRRGTKLILLSATFGRKDIESLGLDKRRVLLVQGKSPIPAESRPIQIDPVGNINYGNIEEMTLKVAQKIENELLPRHTGEKGVIHVTYKQSLLLRKHLNNPRLLWHDKTNKMEQYNKFLSSDSDSVLVASGLYEGIDLPDDLGRWQVVAKIPWLSLADPAIKYKSEVDKEYYLWETAKVVIQACGRVARHEKDYGITYIVDGSCERLFTQLSHLLPDWFKEAIIEKDQ